MRFILLLGLSLIVGLFSLSAMAKEKTVTLDVENMTCALCPYTVKTALIKVDGVLSAKVSYEDQNAVVVFDDEETSIEALTEATADYGYPSHLASDLKE
ncbi:MAG: mercury resistance system periplasmic binding protein MerP [Proteobacteria bacterium]|nr:mercury resistance system periplasmic binding protein MerP [Pseudomonadota bacterium]